MLASSTTDDEGHNSSPSNLYDGRDDADDIYDNEPLILSQPSGNLKKLKILVFFFTLPLRL